MITLQNYDNSNGDARKIYYELDPVSVKSKNGEDDTERLKRLNILTKPWASFAVPFFSEDYINVALTAIDTPLYNSGDIDSI